KTFPEAGRARQLQLVASRGGRDGSLTINQNAAIYLATLDNHATVSHTLEPGRGAWVQVLRGDAEVNNTRITAGDGVAIDDERQVSITGSEATEIMLFDLA